MTAGVFIKDICLTCKHYEKSACEAPCNDCTFVECGASHFEKKPTMKNCDSCRYCGRDWEDHPCKTCEEMKDGSCTNYVPEDVDEFHDHRGCENCKYIDMTADMEPCCLCKGTKEYGSDECKSAPDMWCKNNGDDEPDMVNHPKHYCREGAMECFEEFRMIYGDVAAFYACLFNIHKYRYRSGDKNGLEDIYKSDWYSRKIKELKEAIGIELVIR